MSLEIIKLDITRNQLNDHIAVVIPDKMSTAKRTFADHLFKFKEPDFWLCFGPFALPEPQISQVQLTENYPGLGELSPSAKLEHGIPVPPSTHAHTWS